MNNDDQDEVEYIDPDEADSEIEEIPAGGEQNPVDIDDSPEEIEEIEEIEESNADMIDLTEDDDEIEILEEAENNGETSSEDIQAMYNAPSDLVASTFMNLLNQNQQQAEDGEEMVVEEQMEEIEQEEEEKLEEEEEKVEEEQFVEEKLVEEDDIIVLDGPDEKNDEEKLEARIEKASDFLSWFICLKPEQFEAVKINGPEYLDEIKSDTPLFEAKFALEVMNAYKEKNTLDGLAEQFNLDSEDMVIVAICTGILEEENEADLDFSALCEDRVDEWTLERGNFFLDSNKTGIKAKGGPLKLMQFCLTSPTQTLLMLTVLWLRDCRRPCRLEFWKGDNEEEPPLKTGAMEMCELIMETALKYWNEKKGSEDPEQTSSELDTFFHELEATSAEIDANIQRIQEEKKSILQKSLLEQIDEADDAEVMSIEHMDPKKREQVEKTTSKLEDLITKMKKINEDAEESYKKKGELFQKLLLKPGDWCLARSVTDDNRELVFGRVRGHMDTTTYIVDFPESDKTVNVNIRDIALCNLGLYSPIFERVGDVGLRVAVRQLLDATSFSKKHVWLTGTTAGRRHAHKGDYLVFLDNGKDCYVTVPKKPTDPGFEIATRHSANCSLEEIKEKMTACQMAVMVGQPLTADGNLDRHRACQWIRQPSNANYIREFMKEFPEWQLLRMPVGMTINVFNSLTDKRKSQVRVVGHDRVFAVVRYVTSSYIPGFDCLDYPCDRHQHRDEKIYRGSHRLEGAATKKQMLAKNNNLSLRRRGQFASQFEPTEMERSMPVRKTQHQLPRRNDESEVILVEDYDGMDPKEIESRKTNQNLMLKIVNKIPEGLVLEESKPHDQCGPDCLRGLDCDPYDSRFHKSSPLHAPLMCGWRRKKLTLKSAKRRAPTRKAIQYIAPCSRPLVDMNDVSEYLRQTRCMLTVDCFTFDENVDTETYITVTDPAHVKVDDFSEGHEGIPIPLINSVDDDPPPKLEYSKRRFQYDQSVDLNSINRDFCSGCSCEGDCSDASKCECQQETIKCVERLPKHLQYNGREKMIPQYINRVHQNKVISGLYECNDQCACNRNSCHNRVVQNNIKYPMQIFKTAQSGWGVRALTDIPAGSFICNYVGALLTNDLAEQLKNDDQYFADLDLKDSVETHKILENDPNLDDDYGYGGDDSDEHSENSDDDDGDDRDSADDSRDKTVVHRGAKKAGNSEKVIETRGSKRKGREEENEEEEEEKEQEEVFNWDEYFTDSALFVVDAKQRGNLGRFLNHSCEPNVQVQHVLYDTHDLRLPWVSFFTVKHVKAGEELCWDYAYTVLNPDVERLACHCGAKTCRRRLL